MGLHEIHNCVHIQKLCTEYLKYFEEIMSFQLNNNKYLHTGRKRMKVTEINNI